MRWRWRRIEAACSPPPTACRQTRAHGCQADLAHSVVAAEQRWGAGLTSVTGRSWGGMKACGRARASRAGRYSCNPQPVVPVSRIPPMTGRKVRWPRAPAGDGRGFSASDRASPRSPARASDLSGARSPARGTPRASWAPDRGTGSSDRWAPRRADRQARSADLSAGCPTAPAPGDRAGPRC